MGADIGRVPEDTVRSRPNGAGFPTPEHPKALQGGGFASCDSPLDIPRNGLDVTRSEPLAAQPPPTPPTRCTSVYALTGASEGKPDRPPNGCR